MQKNMECYLRSLNKSRGCVSRSILIHDNETIADDYSIADTFYNFLLMLVPI